MVVESKAVFTDKMSLSSALTQKVFKIINQYTILYRKIRLKELTNENIVADNDWNNCWQNIIEFHYFIEDVYLHNLEDIKIPSYNLTKEEIKEKYLLIVNKYTKMNSIMTISELDFVFRCVRYIASKIGIMDINIYTQIKDDFYEEFRDTDFSKLND